MSTLHYPDFTLKDVLDNLSATELSGLAVSNYESSNSMSAENLRKTVLWTNRGIKAIQSDLNLQLNMVSVIMWENIMEYHLHSSHSIMNEDPLNVALFIADTPNRPFMDDVYQITRILAPDGSERPINVSTDPMSIALPSHDVLMVPHRVDGEVLVVEYVRRTPWISTETYEDADKVLMPIPEYTQEALYAYIEALGGRGSSAENDNRTKAFARYQYEINRLINNPPVQSQTNDTDLFAERGFE